MFSYLHIQLQSVQCLKLCPSCFPPTLITNRSEAVCCIYIIRPPWLKDWFFPCRFEKLFQIMSSVCEPAKVRIKVHTCTTVYIWHYSPLWSLYHWNNEALIHHSKTGCPLSHACVLFNSGYTYGIHWAALPTVLYNITTTLCLPRQRL